MVDEMSFTCLAVKLAVIVQNLLNRAASCSTLCSVRLSIQGRQRASSRGGHWDYLHPAWCHVYPLLFPPSPHPISHPVCGSVPLRTLGIAYFPVEMLVLKEQRCHHSPLSAQDDPSMGSGWLKPQSESEILFVPLSIVAWPPSHT